MSYANSYPRKQTVASLITLPDSLTATTLLTTLVFVVLIGYLLSSRGDRDSEKKRRRDELDRIRRAASRRGLVNGV